MTCLASEHSTGGVIARKIMRHLGEKYKSTSAQWVAFKLLCIISTMSVGKGGGGKASFKLGPATCWSTSYVTWMEYRNNIPELAQLRSWRV
ncbi:hypothetical protein COCVIDRAFT_115898 [Bipolaris victoriae FI3]|uniref:Uncharacterized protein n=1 Tax=Bipolaris victoriae (strain FI3) TaxID=930091 RepID=W7E0U3_BIPV3|nr:hypothetical protein COCVIDRAFT_115898 [Bipolaris victoriae FI3]